MLNVFPSVPPVFPLSVAGYAAKTYAQLERRMGGDSGAMASIVTRAILLSAVTITLVIGVAAY